MTSAAVVVGAFLLGSIPFGFLLVRLVGGADIRDVGSGNIGATNVGRVLGKAGWAATLLADAAKGATPVLVAGALAAGDVNLAAGAAFAAILGHCYTPWLGGKGGKGVATMLGAFAVLAPPSLLAAVVCFGVVAWLSCYVSLASMLAAAAILVVSWLTREPLPSVVAAAATMLLVVVRHRNNLVRLLAGTESRIGGSR